ncbi:MAG: hypothetical protein HQL70_08295 [Magnetococcales bacterium]|nr:hypothetical protein [Magnetococcales bacterium]
MSKQKKKLLPDHKDLIEQLKLCELSTENLDALSAIEKQQRAKKTAECKTEIEAVLKKYNLTLTDVFPASK